jgi:hypothetical protein
MTLNHFSFICKPCIYKQLKKRKKSIYNFINKQLKKIVCKNVLKDY